MFGRKKQKEPFIIMMTFSKETLAEIAKNYLKEELILSKMLRKEKFKYDVRDFMYLNFINDDNKIFKVIFQINIKDNNKEKNKLTELVHEIFECKDFEIQNKKDFNFERFNLRHGLVKNDILIISKENKQEVKPVQSVNDNQNNQQDLQKETINKSYSFNNVVGINNNQNNFASQQSNLNQEKQENIIKQSNMVDLNNVNNQSDSLFIKTQTANANPFGAHKNEENLNSFKFKDEESENLFSDFDDFKSDDSNEDSLFKKPN